MFLSRFYNDMGFEPSQKEIRENFKADLRKKSQICFFITENNA